MADEAREVLIVGLRNAHAVESQAVELLERQVQALDDYPDAQSKSATASRRDAIAIGTG